MKLTELKSPKGANKKTKRRGRGRGSGHGKTSCRGHKGARARSGSGGTSPQFEGGQTPLAKRMPKRGFVNRFKQVYEIINVERLNIFDAGATVTPLELCDRGLIKDASHVKILGGGDIKKPLTVKAHKFAASALSKIEKLGGKAEIII